MNRRVQLVLAGTMGSVAFSTILTFCSGAASLAGSEKIMQVIIAQLPFPLAMGAAIGLIASYIRTNGFLVMIGAALGWFLGGVATVIVAERFDLSRVQNVIVLMGLGVCIGLLPSLIAALRAGIQEEGK